MADCVSSVSAICAIHSAGSRLEARSPVSRRLRNVARYCFALRAPRLTLGGEPIEDVRTVRASPNKNPAPW